jgi:pyridoxamine 5'-phosphate oxidase
MGLFSNASDPFKLFGRWFALAKKKSGMNDPNAICVSTVDEKGRPDARMVLMKDFDEKGFVFYTNLTSPKGRQLTQSPYAAITFHWDKLGLQIRVRGRVKLVPDAEADAYFHSRPRLSQIGAWASVQSTPLVSRALLLARAADVARKYPMGEIPRPPHWSGYRLSPVEMEFWKSKPFRLHDRFLYRLQKRRWEVQRLYP